MISKLGERVAKAPFGTPDGELGRQATAEHLSELEKGKAIIDKVKHDKMVERNWQALKIAGWVLGGSGVIEGLNKLAK